ncbi:MAG: NAD(P)H-binding protein [Gammaproteobacteria bacterium]|nr:NAD(P)H-binding protein [Gammaproteobacteria bacterium]
MSTAVTSNKTVALTGASGFVGQSLLKKLIASGHKVRVLVRNPDTFKQPRLQTSDQLEVIQGNLKPGPHLGQLLQGVEALIHCAGRVRGQCYSEFEEDNVHGTMALIDACKQSPASIHFIQISSLASRQPQLSHYSKSKYEAEQYLQKNHLGRWSIIRPPAIYGGDEQEMRPLFDWMQRGLLWLPCNANNRFSLIHINDLAELIVSHSLEQLSLHKIIEPDDGHENGYSWYEIHTIGSSVFKRKIHLLALPPLLLETAARVNVVICRLLGKSPMLTPEKLSELRFPNWVAAAELAAENWIAVIPLNKGILSIYK